MKKGLVLNEAEGFTLIEIIIIIAIISLFFGTSIAYYNNFSEGKKLKAEADRFGNVVHLAREKAMAGEDEPLSSCSGTPIFGGYQITYTSNSYSLKICCNLVCNTTFTIATYTLPSNIQLDSSSNVIFNSLTGNVPISKTIKITSTSSTIKCYQVDIQSSGLIEESVYDCP